MYIHNDKVSFNDSEFCFELTYESILLLDSFIEEFSKSLHERFNARPYINEKSIFDSQEDLIIFKISFGIISDLQSFIDWHRTKYSEPREPFTFILNQFESLLIRVQDKKISLLYGKY